MAASWSPDRRLGQRLAGLIGATLLSAALLAVLTLGFSRMSKPAADSTSLELRIVQPPPPHLVPVEEPHSRVLRSRIHSRAVPLDREGQTDSASSAGPTFTVQAPSPAASEPALNLKVTSAMLASARGAGADTREDLARLHINDPRSRLERGVEWSSLPDCMSGDALKHAPDLGPYLKLNGLARLPLVVATVATGKCKLP